MNASPAPDKSGVQHWLDALVSNSCSQEEFLRHICDLQANNTDVAWEALALLDQYARRKLISREVFESLTAPLQRLSMGVGDERAPSPAASPVVRPKAPASTSPTAAVPATSATAPSVPTAAPAEAAAATDLIRRPLDVGDVLRGRYRVVDVLRQDGSGALVEAIDELRGNVPGVRSRRAIQLRQWSQQDDPAVLQRLCALHALSHPGIVRVFEIETEPGVAFLVREWLVGVSLHQLMALNGGARLSVPAAQTIIRTLAGALAYAHSRDVCHGDVRTGNIFVTEAGEIRLKGFEIGGDWQVNPRSDGLAFARVVYELLSGSHWSGEENDGLVKRARLREPCGLTREQWRALRDTLLGRERSRRTDVLKAFADSEDVATGRVTLSQAFARTPTNLRALNSGMAWGLVAALIAAAVYLIVSQGRSPDQVDTALPPAISSALDSPPAESPPLAASQPDTPSVPAPATALPQPTGELATEAVPAAAPLKPVPTRYVPSKVDLPSDTLEVRADQPVARIWVRRSGGLNRAVTFRWWTETGSAKADVDFGAVAPQLAEIPNGAHGVALMVPLVSDPSRRDPRTFYVKIDEPGSDANLGERTLVQVTILPAGRDEDTR